MSLISLNVSGEIGNDLENDHFILIFEQEFYIVFERSKNHSKRLRPTQPSINFLKKNFWDRLPLWPDQLTTLIKMNALIGRAPIGYNSCEVTNILKKIN